MVIKGGDSEQRHKSPTRRSPGKHPQAGQHHMEEASRHTEGRRVWQGKPRPRLGTRVTVPCDSLGESQTRTKKSSYSQDDNANTLVAG